MLKFPRLASLQYPFPNFGLQAPPIFIDAFTQIAEQVALDNPNIGVHRVELGQCAEPELDD